MRAKSLTAERFKTIVAAYGASPARWPESERASALAFMNTHPERVEAWLADALATDQMLDVLKLADVDSFEQAQSQHWQALAQIMQGGRSDNVVAFRPKVAPRSRPLGLIWATGIGLAACIAGAGVGMKVSLLSLSNVRAQNVLEQVQMVDTEN